MKASPLPCRPLRIAASPATSRRAAATKVSQATAGIRIPPRRTKQPGDAIRLPSAMTIDIGQGPQQGCVQTEGLTRYRLCSGGVTAAQRREAQVDRLRAGIYQPPVHLHVVPGHARGVVALLVHTAAGMTA